MGIWELHIHAMHEMMPYLAASGNNLHTKCIRVYLQQIHKLHEAHPEVSKHIDHMTDSCELLEFLEYRNPFSDNCSLQSIPTGINAVIRVNVDTAKDVGEKILTSMAQQKVLQHDFKKKYQAVTLSTTAVKVNAKTIQIDPQLLFQRLITA